MYSEPTIDKRGVGARHQRSLGTAACYLLVMLTAALLMTSSHSEGRHEGAVGAVREAPEIVLREAAGLLDSHPASELGSACGRYCGMSPRELDSRTDALTVLASFGRSFINSCFCIIRQCAVERKFWHTLGIAVVGSLLCAKESVMSLLAIRRIDSFNFCSDTILSTQR